MYFILDLVPFSFLVAFFLFSDITLLPPVWAFSSSFLDRFGHHPHQPCSPISSASPSIFIFSLYFFFSLSSSLPLSVCFCHWFRWASFKLISIAAVLLRSTPTGNDSGGLELRQPLILLFWPTSAAAPFLPVDCQPSFLAGASFCQAKSGQYCHPPSTSLSVTSLSSSFLSSFGFIFS